MMAPKKIVLIKPVRISFMLSALKVIFQNISWLICNLKTQIT